MLITLVWHFVSFMSNAGPVIETAPGEVWNVTGSQVFLSCEATGIPTPVLTWRKVENKSKKAVNLSILLL